MLWKTYCLTEVVCKHANIMLDGQEAVGNVMNKGNVADVFMDNMKLEEGRSFFELQVVHENVSNVGQATMKRVLESSQLTG